MEENKEKKLPKSQQIRELLEKKVDIDDIMTQLNVKASYIKSVQAKDSKVKVLKE